MTDYDDRNGTLTVDEFVAAARQFCELSSKLRDSWELVEPSNSPVYLRKQLKQVLFLPHSKPDEPSEFEELAVDDPSSVDLSNNCGVLHSFEYHVVYSVSYQVPILYFNVHKSDGTMLTLEQAWTSFRELAGESRDQLRQTLTQMEHPVLFRPFLALHPCRTAQVLATTVSGRGRGRGNRIVSFLSIYGPFVNLELDLRYGAEL